MTATNPTKATARFDHDDPPRHGPKLDDVADAGRLAIFDPEKCGGEHQHWIQIDAEYALTAKEAV